MITLIVGTVPLLQKRALETIQEQWREAQIDSFDGEELEVGSLSASCSNLSLFSKQRLVIVRRAEQLEKIVQEELLALLPQLSPTVHLVLVAEKVDGRLQFWKQIQKKGEVRNVDPPPPAQQRRWLACEWQRRGKTVAPEAFEAMVLAARDDFLQVVQAIERIDLYLGSEKEVDLACVDRCSGGVATVQIFSFTQVLGAQDWKRAFLMLIELWQREENPHGILALLVRHFRLLLQIQECGPAGKGRGELAALLGIPPYFLDDYLRQAGAFPEAQLRKLWSAFRLADEQLKTSRGEKKWVLEELFWKLRGEGGKAAMQT